MVQQSPFLKWFKESFIRDETLNPDQWIYLAKILGIFESHHEYDSRNSNDKRSNYYPYNVTLEFITEIFDGVSFFKKDVETDPNGYLRMKYWQERTIPATAYI